MDPESFIPVLIRGITDIREAYEYGVGIFTAESVRQADLLQQVVASADSDQKAEVILRLNAGSQFGMQRGCI